MDTYRIAEPKLQPFAAAKAGLSQGDADKACSFAYTMIGGIYGVRHKRKNKGYWTCPVYWRVYVVNGKEVWKLCMRWKWV